MSQNLALMDTLRVGVEAKICLDGYFEGGVETKFGFDVYLKGRG